MAQRVWVYGFVGLVVSCGGKVTFVDDGGEGGAGPTPSTTTSSGNSPTTSGGGGGAGNSGGIGVGGFMPPQSESCDDACESIAPCLDQPNSCAESCAFYREFTGCEQAADEYLACVRQDQLDICSFGASCLELGFSYLDCQNDLPQDGGCAFGEDGSCSCEVFTQSGHIIGASCLGDLCVCSNDGEGIGSCDNSFNKQCDPFFNCCSSMNLVVGFDLPTK